MRRSKRCWICGRRHWREGKERIRPLFRHPSVADAAAAFLDGLLGPERRKTGWMRAEAAGDAGPWRQQAVLGCSIWEADALRDLVRDYAIETLASPTAVLVIDETGFSKAGQEQLWRCAPVHGLGRQDHLPEGEAQPQLPDRGVCRLCFGAWSCLYRPPALSAQELAAQELDGRS